MKTRTSFQLRMDNTPEANIRRLHAYIRKLQRDCPPTPKPLQRVRRKAILRQVK